ncbi:MAG: hypothetical protein LBG88_01590 [Christensenellaceae bacterium]|nr:hypothetical protein [Christensenellaceae bacterium]
MLIKIKLDGTSSLIDIARTCKVAPCQILIVNGVQNEIELMEKAEIFVPVSTGHMVI